MATLTGSQAGIGKVFVAGAEVPVEDEPWATLGTDVDNAGAGAITGNDSYQLSYEAAEADCVLEPRAEGYTLSPRTLLNTPNLIVTTFRLRPDQAAPDDTLSWLQLCEGVGDPTGDIFVTWESDGKIRLRDGSRTGDELAVSSGNPFTDDTVSTIRGEWDNTYGDNGRIRVWVDGDLELSHEPGAVEYKYWLWGGGSDKNVDCNILINLDDLFQTTVAANDPGLGNTPLVLLGVPTASGTHDDWTGDWDDWNDGAAGNDGAATTRDTAAEAGVKEATDACTDYPDNSYDDIWGVMLVDLQLRPADGGVEEVYTFIKDGANEEGIGVRGSLADVYDPVYGGFNERPASASLWTAAAVDSMEIGMYRTDVSKTWKVTSLYYYLAATEGTPPSGRRIFSC